VKTNRRKILKDALAASFAAGGTSWFLSGCEGLDYSASAEGTGVQVIGAIVVLARYHANARQKAVAEQRGRAAVVRYAKPAYEKRRAVVHESSRKKIETASHDYDKRIASAAKSKPAAPPAPTPAPSPPSAPPPANVEVQRLQTEKEKALAKLRADAESELASVDNAWRSLGGEPVHASVADSKPHGPPTVIPESSTRDEEALLASASAHLPNYVAVSVPPQGIAAEKGGKANVMLWDIRRHRLASEDVLVLDRTVRDGVDAKVDGRAARFILAGP